jgi:hypothetical protein
VKRGNRRKIKRSKKIKEDKEEQVPLLLPSEAKEVEDPEKLHALRKFKIDDETIQELFEYCKGRIHEFFISLAKYLPDYFQNNREFMRYIHNSCYVDLRVKVIFSKDVLHQVEG